MMKEPCPIDNGVQVRYKGKAFCTTHDDLEAALSSKEVTYAEVATSLKDMLLTKIKEDMVLLEKEKDVAKQEQLVSLLAKSVELLNKLESSQRS